MRACLFWGKWHRSLSLYSSVSRHYIAAVIFTRLLPRDAVYTSVVCCNRCSFIYSVSQSVSRSVSQSACHSACLSVRPSVCHTSALCLNIWIIPTFSRTKLRCRIQAVQTQRTGLNSGWTWFWQSHFCWNTSYCMWIDASMENSVVINVTFVNIHSLAWCLRDRTGHTCVPAMRSKADCVRHRQTDRHTDTCLCAQ